MRHYLLVIVFASLLLSSCSPGYVMRASWEEAGILWTRQSIAELLEQPNLDQQIRHKLELSQQAREISKTLGLVADGSFTSYSVINRDVLVWVLSAVPVTSLQAKTWWFPVVGSIQYKGFFDKEDGIAEQNNLREKGFDTFLRTSAAFSTLGWFDDPLLSTEIKFSDADLVETIIHEIFHNTVWIKGHIAFNETVANFVGAQGAILFFEQASGLENPNTIQAKNSWKDELIFARFLEDLYQRLDQFYKEQNPESASNLSPASRQKILDGRALIYTHAKQAWAQENSKLQTDRYKKLETNLNNASLVALRFYLTEPWIFEELYELCGHSMPKFIEEIQAIVTNSKDTHADPFQITKNRITQLKTSPPS